MLAVESEGLQVAVVQEVLVLAFVLAVQEVLVLLRVGLLAST